MKPVIFSVEDDFNISNVIKIALENSQFKIVSFNNAKELFQGLQNEIPDLFLLDIMLPDMDGLEIIRKIKRNLNLESIPIMIISAKSLEIDRVIGIDLGADDYLIKPFGVLELVSRVKALLRRNPKVQSPKQFEIKGLILDFSGHKVTYLNQEIAFTKKQFDLFKCIVEKQPNTVTRDECLNKVWGYEFFGETRTLDVHVNEIRKKLKKAGIHDQVIETVRGVGYRFTL